MKFLPNFLVVCLTAFQLAPCRGETLPPEKQKKVDEIVAQVQSWATDPLIVNAVKSQNAHLPEEIASITLEKWDSLTIMDPLVRGLLKNEVSVFLKSKMTEALTLALVNDASGHKVGFASKPKNWLHKGMPQHEDPMNGKIFQGPLTVHPATGMYQLLLGIPVVDAGKPIGVIIVGVKATALE